MARNGTLGLATLLLATPVLAGAAAGRHGAVADVPLARTGWTPQGWTGPEDGPDMTRLPADARRVADVPPVRTPPPVPARPVQTPPVVRAAPPVRYAAPVPVAPPVPVALPHDGRYVRPDRGGVLPGLFATPAYRVTDYQARGLAAPGTGRHWVRYYDDAVLLGPGGRIDDVRYGLDWRPVGAMPLARNDRRLPPSQRPMPDRAYADGYEDGYDDGHDDGAAWAEDAVTSGGRWQGGPPAYGQPRYYAPGTVVVTTTPGTVTTTTTVTEDVVYTRIARPRRRAAPVRTKSWAAPARRWSQ